MYLFFFNLKNYVRALFEKLRVCVCVWFIMGGDRNFISDSLKNLDPSARIVQIFYIVDSISFSCSSVSLTTSHSFSSFAILLAIFLKPMLVPEILLNRTPFRDSRGSLHTSISHWTKLSAFGSPCTQSSKNLSRCS